MKDNYGDHTCVCGNRVFPSTHQIVLVIMSSYPTENSILPGTIFPFTNSTGQYLPHLERCQRKLGSSTPVPEMKMNNQCKTTAKTNHNYYVCDYRNMRFGSIIHTSRSCTELCTKYTHSIRPLLQCFRRHDIRTSQL